MIKHRHFLLPPPSWPLLLGALLIYGLIFSGWLNGIRLVRPLNLLLHVLIVVSGLLLMGFLFAQRSPKFFAPVKIILGASVFLSVLFYVLALLVGAESSRSTDIVAASGQGHLHYVAVRSGGAGNTWTDIVERRTYGFILIRERNIAQYERENVVHIDDSESGKLKIHLRELGKPDRVDEISGI